MPEVDDILQFTIVTELEGVAMRNTMYWQLDNKGNTDDLAAIATILGDAYIDVSEALLSTVVDYTAFLVDNLTRNEVRGVVTTERSGSQLRDSHPQDQVLRFNEWAPSATKEVMHRGAFNLSGIVESLSTDGRVNDIVEFNALAAFLSSQHLDATSGLQTSPHVRRRVPGSQPPVYTFHPIEKAQVNPTFFKLKSRKTQILGF